MGSGQAKVEYPMGDLFEGNFKDGKREGQGVYEYYQITGRDKFTGVFEDNKRTGLGRMEYCKGGFYHGYFVNGKRHGEGTFKYKNGDIYSGNWREGKRHGQGTYVFVNTKYEMKGIWKDGKITKGTWTLTDGTRYV